LSRSGSELEPEPGLPPFSRRHVSGVPQDLPHFRQHRIVTSPEIQSPDISPGNNEGGAQFATGTFQIGHEWIVVSLSSVLSGITRIGRGSSPSLWSANPPLAQHFPRRHQVLNGARPRQPIAFHAAGFVCLAVRICNMMWRQHGQAARPLLQFRLRQRAISNSRDQADEPYRDRITPMFAVCSPSGQTRRPCSRNAFSSVLLLLRKRLGTDITE
jgi:hypothetical protein